MTTSAYTVSGMNCEHCVRSVTEEIEQVPAVSSVAVDLADGRVTVESDGALDDDAIRAAVTEAGFELVGRA